MATGTMVMLIGPTGSGKSTLRRDHLAHLPCVCPDDFIVGKFSPRKRVHAWANARQQAIEMLVTGESFVVDSQFVDPDLRREWACLAKGFGFSVHAVIMVTPWTQLRKNQKARGARGFYGEIPYAVQREMFTSFKKQFRKGGLLFDELQYSRVTVVRWGSKDDLRRLAQ